MGKVRQRVIEHIENGTQIASNVTTDHLITAGVSNWGGSALAAALFVLSQCPVHSSYARRGVGKEREVSLEDVLNSVEKVRSFLTLDSPPRLPTISNIKRGGGWAERVGQRGHFFPFRPVMHRHFPRSSASYFCLTLLRNVSTI